MLYASEAWSIDKLGPDACPRDHVWPCAFDLVFDLGAAPCSSRRIKNDVVIGGKSSRTLDCLRLIQHFCIGKLGIQARQIFLARRTASRHSSACTFAALSFACTARRDSRAGHSG